MNPAKPPFNLDELRANIGDDRETERSLLSMFVHSAEESLTLLNQHFPEHETESFNSLWHAHMHQLKGSSLNIGADKLTRLANEAMVQANYGLTLKRMLLNELAAEFVHVKQFIDGLNPPALAS